MDRSINSILSAALMVFNELKMKFAIRSRGGFDESRIEYKSSPGFWYYGHQIRVRFQPFCWPEGARYRLH